MPFFKLGNRVEVSRNQEDIVALSDGTVLQVGTSAGGAFGWQAYEVDGTPIGGFHSINTRGIPGLPFSQEVEAAPDGGFWIMAQSASGSPVGLLNDDVFVRRFDADLEPVTDFGRVSRPKADRQDTGAIAVGPAGQASVSFTDHSATTTSTRFYETGGFAFNNTTRGTDVYRVLLDSDGSVSGPLRPAHLAKEPSPEGSIISNAGIQVAGQPAILANGSTVIPYFDVTVGIRPGTNNVMARPSISVSIDRNEIDVFAPDNFNSGPLEITPTQTILPQAVALDGGGFIVTWTMTLKDEGQFVSALFAQAYSAGGGPVGPQVRVSPIGLNVTTNAELVPMNTGGAAIIYNVRPVAAGLQADVIATTLSAEGVLGDVHEVATGPASQSVQSATRSPEGSILVTYIEGTSAFTERLVFDDGQSSTFTGTNTRDVYHGDSLKNWVDAEGGNDFVRLNAGNDRGHGGNGNDTVRGGDGHDLITGGRGQDNLLGERGFDTISGGGGNDTILGGSFADHLDGGANDDMLRGQAGDDMIAGGNGNDTLNGAAGDDTLDGGAGFDRMFGGAGADTFVLRRGPVQSDEIRGFAVGVDRIAIDGDSLDGIEVINADGNSILVLGDGVEAVLVGVTATLAELDLLLI